MTSPIPVATGATVRVAPPRIPTVVAAPPTPPAVVVLPVQGIPGLRGPAGAGGFTYTQASPAATWTIPNQLGHYPASVLVLINTEVVDADIDIPDTSTIVVVFATPQSGQAVIL